MEESSEILDNFDEQAKLRKELEQLQEPSKKRLTKQDIAKKKKQELKKKQEEEEQDRQIRIEKLRQKAHFENNIDLGGLIAMGFVFFLTCFIGLLYNVSPKVLSTRVLISFGFAFVLVCICTRAIKKHYLPTEDESDAENKADDKADDNEDASTIKPDENESSSQ